MLDVKFPFKTLIYRQTLCTPPVPIQFVVPHVEDRDKLKLIEMCVKRDVLKIIDLNLKLF